MVVSKRQGFEFLRDLVRSSEDDSRVTDVSYVELASLEDDNSSGGPGCAGEAVSRSWPFI